MGYVEDSETNPYAAPLERAVPLHKVGFTGYAGFWKRFAAVFIDTILIGVVNFGIGFVVGIVMAIVHADPTVVQAVAFIVGLVVSYGYYAGMTSSASQATLGKMALGIKVTDMQGRRLSFGRALGREVAKILSGLILLIGYIMAAFTEKKQALHDMIAGTLVVSSN